MANDSANARSAVTGEISVGAVGAAAPTDATTALAEHTGLGYINEDGVEITPEKSVDDKKAWQNAAIVRSVVTDSALRFRFTMIETKVETVELYWSTAVTQTVDHGTFDIDPSAGERKSFVIEYDDNGALERYFVPEGEVTAREPIRLQSGELVGYGVEITAYPSASLGGKPARVWSTALAT